MASYSPVFSQGFIYYTSAAPNTDFLVPAGFTAVIRDAIITQTIGGYLCYLFVGESESAPLLTVWSSEADGANLSNQWTGRVVVNEGGLIRIGVSALGSSPSMYVGGYLLRNTLT